jgi:anti-sigma28 factor (negative regulator of flagellin synthesis)
MSRINGVGSNIPLQQLTSQPVIRYASTADAKPMSTTDKLELSGMSHLLKSLKSNDVRTGKIADIRAQIETGSYEDDRKLDIAVDRLLDDLNK